MTLRVIVQIIPYGDESRMKEIGRLNISNVGPVPQPDTYAYRIVDGGTEWVDFVTHKRADGFWVLIHKALTSMFRL